MAYARSYSISVSLSTVGKSTTATWSTVINGLLECVQITTTGAAATTTVVRAYSSASTGLAFQTSSIANSTLGGAVFWPRRAVKALAGSSGLRGRIPLVENRLAVTVTKSSSGIGSGTLTFTAFVI